MTYACFVLFQRCASHRTMHMSYHSKTYTWNDVILVKRSIFLLFFLFFLSFFLSYLSHALFSPLLLCCKVHMFQEQRLYFKFYFELGKTPTETYKMLQQTFVGTTMCLPKILSGITILKPATLSVKIQHNSDSFCWRGCPMCQWCLPWGLVMTQTAHRTIVECEVDTTD